MGKYNFSAMRFEELAKQLEELKEQNESLQAEIKELKYGKKARRSLIRDISNGEKASALFGIKAANGKLAPAADKFTSHFCTFYQGLFRFIVPDAYKDPTSGIERVVYRKLEKVTDDEYKILCETLEATIDLLYYAKEKVEKSKEVK